MREIKFRAWDKKSGTMLHWGSSIIMIDHQLNIHSIVNNVYMAFDVELMQYTGLKDKNGKEIYEGDIVKTEHGAIGIMKWHEQSAQFNYDCSEPFWSHPIYSMSGDKEVIGNIYENPDLLTSSHD